MATSRTYTLSELESQSGFDKRTISYYISEGLLPKVGRRGPKSSYPQEVLDRLMFIRRVRDLQDAGELRAVTLSEIRNVLDYLPSLGTRTRLQTESPADNIRNLFEDPDGAVDALSMPAEEIAGDASGDLADLAARTVFDSESLMAPPSARRDRMRSQVEQERPPSWSSLADEAPATRALAPDDPEKDLQRLGELLREIQKCAEQGAGEYHGSLRDHLIRVPIADDIRLSVRNLGADDAHLADELAALLKRVMRG